MSDFFTRLDKLRREHGEKIIDIAHLLGISGPAVHGWKKGGLPTADKLAVLADHYGVSAAYLVSGSNMNASLVREGRYCYPLDERDRLETENAELRKRLDEAMAIIRDQAAALASVGRSGNAVHAYGANCGSTDKLEGRSGA